MPDLWSPALRGPLNLSTSDLTHAVYTPAMCACASMCICDPLFDNASWRPQTQDFHGRYYHPSNARIWFYGDDPPEERLRLLAAYLDDFEAREVLFCEPVSESNCLFSHNSFPMKDAPKENPIISPALACVCVCGRCSRLELPYTAPQAACSLLCALSTRILLNHFPWVCETRLD